MSPASPLDRTAMRQRPAGCPVMHQVWDRLLFLHWPVDAGLLRPLVPSGLEIETWEGSAWIGVTPFTIRGIRPPFLPPLPGISRSHELNVRTYVTRDGQPGVWFLSLDASNALAVWAARLSYSLPYYRARMDMKASGPRVDFQSRRTHADAPPASFQIRWLMGARLPEAAPNTREFFLIERYALYSSRGGRLYRARIHHRPWPLARAQVEELQSTLLEAHGLPSPTEPPLVHAQAEGFDVEIWPLERVA